MGESTSGVRGFEYEGIYRRVGVVSSLTSTGHNSQSRSTLLGSGTSRKRRRPLVAGVCGRWPENSTRHVHACKPLKRDKKPGHVDGCLPVFRVRTCRRRDPEAPGCERGVQSVLGLASLGAGGKGKREGGIDVGRAGRLNGVGAMEPPPSASRVVPLVHN